MKRKKKILFVHTTLSTFVKTDFEILSENYEVTKYQFIPVKGFVNTAIQFIKQFFYLLFNLWWFDAVFIWFADYHSFLPVLFAKILNKKSFVVIGGYDVARIPDLQYGVFDHKIRGFCALFTMNYCSLNLTVSKYVDRKVKWIAPHATRHLIYNCVNLPEGNNTPVKKENLIISVGLIDSEKTYYLKGIDTFFEVARLLPQFNFVIVGISKSLQNKNLPTKPKNLQLIEPVNHQELENYYKRAKIYCQFSRSESFGVAIVEAMIFGCIPVVTDVGGMPEIVGNYGIVTKREASAIADLIQKKLQNFPQIQNESNTELILNPFLFRERNKNLLKTMNQLL